MQKAMLKAEDIRKSFGSLAVLKGIDFKVERGEIVSIMGASGAGKSTLLQVLGTIEKAEMKKLVINGEEVSKLGDKALSAFRNKNIGFVFQFHHLLPEFTALENICIPAYIGGNTRNAARKKAMDLLTLLGLTDRASHKPSELSGGEQQRIAVARALINEPGIVFADEPSGNLDSQSSEMLHKLFLKLRKDLGQTFVIVTHNKQLAGMADRKMVIKDGLLSRENNASV
jgi:lipoprotein-releasing system ATP-binding protein